MKSSFADINKLLKGIAQTISDVFSPLLIPTYTLFAVLWLTPMALLPTSVRLWSTAGIFFITCMTPLSFILVMMRLGYIHDASISHRRERFWPYFTTILCYILAAVYLSILHAPLWLWIFFIGAAIYSVFSMIISKWWKISAHSGAIGGMVGIILWLCQHRFFIFVNPLIILSIAILLSGLMAWARLYLQRHTILQVFAGTFLAFAVEYSILTIFLP